MKIGIIGAGKVGATIATLLESCAFCDAVRLGDARTDLKLAGLEKSTAQRLDVKRAPQLAAFVRRCDAVVSAAPYFLNRAIAEACAAARVSYFDLTEDVATTKFIRGLARKTKGATFMPQCGLAPGAINIVGGSLAGSLEAVRSVEMRVGALPQFASNQMKYYLSWSTAGLINEYCQLGEALHEGRRITTLPLDGCERLTIDGVEYEAFNTSGGVATMCETFAGKVGEHRIFGGGGDQVGVVDHRLHGVVELVGNPADQGAQRLSVLLTEQLLFDDRALGGVHDHPDHAHPDVFGGHQLRPQRQATMLSGR